MNDRILNISKKFEHLIVSVLLGMLWLVVLIGTLGLAIMICTSIYERATRQELSDVNFTMPLLHDVFTGFLMILIGLELMKTVEMYLDRHVIHVEVVLSVAMIGIARHVIDIDLKTAPAFNLVGTGAIIFALAVGYFYFRKAGVLAAAGTDMPQQTAAGRTPTGPVGSDNI